MRGWPSTIRQSYEQSRLQSADLDELRHRSYRRSDARLDCSQLHRWLDQSGDLALALIREDELGLYVIAGGYIGRPGDVPGYSHALPMTSGGVKTGDKVKARHVASNPLIKLITPEGLRWWYTGSRTNQKG